MKSPGRYAISCMLFVSSVCGAVVSDECVVDDEISNSRPRLFLDDSIRGNANNLSTAASTSIPWKYLRQLVDRNIDHKVRQLTAGDASGAIRIVSDRIPFYLMTYLATGERLYAVKARSLVDELMDLRSWGTDHDIGAAHVIFNLSLYYDWMYDELSEKEKSELSIRIARHADMLASDITEGKIWWARKHSLLQNHNYVNAMSIAVAAVSLHGDVEQAESWLKISADNFESVFDLLTTDGSSHEGVAYWSYAVDALMKYIETAPCLPENVNYQHGFLANAIDYRLFMTLPGFSDTANYSDSPQRDYKGPGYILRRLAEVHRDGRGLWLANSIESARTHNTYSWLDVLWDGDAVEAQPVPDGEAFHLFEESGMYVSRTGWGVDDSWVMFKVGPYQGVRALSSGIFPGSHVHPDAGHVSLWAAGNWVLNDDGYNLFKSSLSHNTLIVNRAEQYGGGKRWFDRMQAKKNNAVSRVVRADIDSDGDSRVIVANLRDAYQRDPSISSISRTFVDHGGGVYLVVDEVVGKSLDVVSVMHSQYPVAQDGVRNCFGDVYLMGVGTGSELVMQSARYALPVRFRRKDKGLYDGWRIASAASASDRIVLVHAFHPVKSDCEKMNYVLKLDTEKVEFKVEDEVHQYTVMKTRDSRVQHE